MSTPRSMKPLRTSVLFTALLFASSATAQDRWVISADTVYTAAGDPIENGSVVVADGKIAALGPGGGTKLEVAAVTPGFVDLSVGIDTGTYSVEQTTETAVTSSVAETLDFFSYRWNRQLASGVTTVLSAPSDFNVIGGLCLVHKTGGEPTLEARLLKEDVALRASIGKQSSLGNSTPSRFRDNTIYVRRPTTRMGVEWVFRKAYYDAINAKRFGLDVSEEEAAQNAILQRTMDGELPVFVHAMATQDVRTSIFLKNEFGIDHMIIDHAVEAWKEIDLVQESGVGIVLPPVPKDGRVRDPYANDSYMATLDAAKRLSERGVPIALSGDGASSAEARIAHQAGYAIRGGLSFEAALAAVTIGPAKMIGVDDRVGSIEVGKDADLVLWNGKPFEPTSAIVGVLLDGQLVIDPRPADEGAGQ